MPAFLVGVVVEMAVPVEAGDESAAVAAAVKRTNGRPETVQRAESDTVREVAGRCEACSRYLLDGDAFVMSEGGDLCRACCDELAEAG